MKLAEALLSTSMNLSLIKASLKAELAEVIKKKNLPPWDSES